MVTISRKIVLKAAAVGILMVLLPAGLFASSYGPVGFPKTLLSLYQESDVIVVAKYAKTARGQAVREDSDFAILKTDRYFDVSYVLKGEHSKFLVIGDEEFVSKDSPAAADVEQTVDDEYHILAGDTVLLFLRKSEDGKSLEFVNSDDSLKKLNSRDLAVYEARIAELRSMYEGGQPEPAKLLDWLITCAQDPATRWEGAFELVTILERAEYQAKQPVSDTKQISTVPSTKFDRAIFAKVITDDQKIELANILLIPAAAGNSSVRGDEELMDLIVRWGDSRLAGYLIEQIRNNPKPSYGLTFKVRTLLKLLNDKKAEQLAARIDENVAINDGNEAVKTEHEAVLKFVNYAQSKLSNTSGQ